MAALVQGCVAFLSVPFLIGVVGATNFGLWAIFEPLVILLSQVALMGCNHGAIKLLASGQKDSREFIFAFLKNGVFFCAVISVAGGIAATLALGFLPRYLMALLAGLYIFLEALIVLLQSIARGESDSLSYAITIWIKFGLVGLILLALSLASVSLSLANFASILIALDVVVLLVLWRRRTVGESMRQAGLGEREIYWRAARYGFPIVIAVGFALFVANGDRYIVHALMDSGQLAGYMTMAKLAGAMSFAAAPVNLWWPAARFQHASDPDGGAAFYDAATLVLLIYYGLAALGVWALIPYVVHWYSHGVQGFNAMVMGLLLCTSVAAAMVTPLNVGALNEGKTHWIMWSIGFSAVVGLIASIGLIPRLGYLGAALAVLAAQTTSLVVTHVVSQRIQYYEFRYGKKFLLLGLFVACGAAMRHFEETFLIVVVCGVIALVISVFLGLKDIKRVIQ